MKVSESEGQGPGGPGGFCVGSWLPQISGRWWTLTLKIASMYLVGAGNILQMLSYLSDNIEHPAGLYATCIAYLNSVLNCEVCLSDVTELL